MSSAFQFFVEPRDLSKAVRDLSKLNGIQISLPASQALEEDQDGEHQPDLDIEHPSYSLTFAELSPIIVSVTTATASLISLASAILQYRKAAKEAEKATKGSKNDPLIIFGDTSISISQFTTPDALAAYLQERLKGIPREPPT